MNNLFYVICNITTGARVNCPKEYLGKEAYLIIPEGKHEK